MAELDGNLWEYNLVKVLVVDVTDDYRLMQPPLPSTYYPVLKETWLPRHGIGNMVTRAEFMTGYLYDWHERPNDDAGAWYVGVVSEALAHDPKFESLFAEASA